MITHIAIEFEGSPQTVVDFFKHKNLIKNHKIINPNKIFIEIDQENHEEVMFFKNFVLDDFKGEKILHV